MSREVGDDERRLYQNVRKYDKIVKQFEDLIEIMNSQTKPVKRRKNSKGNGSTTASISSVQHEDKDEVFVKTITRFLNDLKTSSPDPSTSTSRP